MSTLKEANTCPDGYRALSTSELQELLQNDEKMDQILRLNEKRHVPLLHDDLPEDIPLCLHNTTNRKRFQDLQVDREMLLSTNRSVAEESLARQPQLNNGKLQLAEKYRELSNLATTCWEKQSQLGEFEKVDKEEEGGGGLMFLVSCEECVQGHW
ncbi:Vacuolar protein sorting-associated protein 37D [Dissostichus eleginoides]|uniref:Vacuolar protein sorting-associated protein 37D n=1 Tax=Dissostichus eleginoides TaxID=100907 RepID=A0AAD9BG36_DISEL|nr:Vacuolar protein sorting-associated protein 37D [Dissostichus eleginoides]